MLEKELRNLEQGVYLIKEGDFKKIESPTNGFGKQIITWQNGKPTIVEVQSTKKI